MFRDLHGKYVQNQLQNYVLNDEVEIQLLKIITIIYRDETEFCTALYCAKHKPDSKIIGISEPIQVIYYLFFICFWFNFLILLIGELSDNMLKK